MKTLITMAVAVCCVVWSGPTQGIGTASNLASATKQRGTLIRLEPLEVLARAQLQTIAAEFPGTIAVANDVRLFRITYWTLYKGAPAQASGLLALPQTAAPPKAVMTYFHGTNATRSLAPSQPDRVDGNEEAAIFAGNGYAVILPDYIGLGVSTRPQAYVIVQPQVDASIDLLRAAQQAAAGLRMRWPTDLVMMGFSQGGQVVAGVHRALERQPLAPYRLLGSVGIAGPYDLRRASLPKAIENRCRQCVGYLAWAVHAYATYYEHPVGSAFKPAYSRLVPELFDGTKTAAEIGAALPDDPADMFAPAFLAAMRAGSENWFTVALDRNETFAWTPVAPLRLYHGENDVDVSPLAAEAFLDFARRRDGNITLHSLPGADHQASAALSYAPTLRWFDEMTKRR